MLDALVFNLIAVAVAVTWTLLLRVRPMALIPPIVVTLYLVVTQAWVLVSGLVGQLNVVAWRFIATGLVFALVIVWGLGGPHLRGEAARWRARWHRVMAALGRWRVAVMATACAATLVWVGVIAWLIGPWLPDVLSYHLVPPADWVADGGLTNRDWPDVRTWWPAGNGLLMAWWMTPLGELRGATLTGVAWVALTLCTAWTLARQMGATVRVAWGAVLLTLCVPIVWAQGTITLNDLAVATLALVAVAAVSGRRVRAAHVMLALAAIAVGLGVKGTPLLIGPPIVAVGVLRWWRCRRVRAADTIVTSRDPAANSARRAILVTTLVVTAAVGSVWYVRNMTVHPSGNPLFPAKLRLLGNTLYEGHPHFSRQHGHFSWAQFTGNAFDIFYHKGWDRSGDRSGQTAYSTGFGLLAMALGWPATLALLAFAPRSRPAVVTVMIMMLVLMAGVADDPWSGRFFAFVPVLLVVCVAMITPRLARGAPLLLWGALVASAAMWSLGIAVRYSAPPIAWSAWQTQGVGEVSLATMLIGHPHGYLVESVNVVPPDATLAVVVPGRPYVPIAPLHGESLGRRFVYYTDFGHLPGPALRDAWRRAGVRWVAVVVPFAELRDIDIAMEQAGFTRTAEGVYAIP